MCPRLSGANRRRRQGAPVEEATPRCRGQAEGRREERVGDQIKECLCLPVRWEEPGLSTSGREGANGEVRAAGGGTAPSPGWPRCRWTVEALVSGDFSRAVPQGWGQELREEGGSARIHSSSNVPRTFILNCSHCASVSDDVYSACVYM